MKKTSFRMIEDYDVVKKVIEDYLPSFNEEQIEIVEEDSGYTVNVIYDDTDLSVRELEDCFMHVMLLDNPLDAWNMIQQYSEKI